MTNDQLSINTNDCVAARHYYDVPKALLHWSLVIGYWSLLVITAVGGLGCARTVTSYVEYGDQMVVDITFRGTIDATNNRYFMVLSSNNNFKVPLPAPDNPNYYEMVEPGTQPMVGSIESYYTNFYSGWSGYIRADPGGYFIVAGPFVLGGQSTSEFLSSPSVINNKMNFVFNLSQVFGATVPSTIYFDVVSVPWPNSGQKLPVDHINATNAYIAKIKGSNITVTDLTDATVPLAALDIVSATVTIQ